MSESPLCQVPDSDPDSTDVPSPSLHLLLLTLGTIREVIHDPSRRIPSFSSLPFHHLTPFQQLELLSTLASQLCLVGGKGEEDGEDEEDSDDVDERKSSDENVSVVALALCRLYVLEFVRVTLKAEVRFGRNRYRNRNRKRTSMCCGGSISSGVLDPDFVEFMQSSVGIDCGTLVGASGGCCNTPHPQQLQRELSDADSDSVSVSGSSVELVYWRKLLFGSVWQLWRHDRGENDGIWEFSEENDLDMLSCPSETLWLKIFEFIIESAPVFSGFRTHKQEVSELTRSRLKISALVYEYEQQWIDEDKNLLDDRAESYVWSDVVLWLLTNCVPDDVEFELAKMESALQELRSRELGMDMPSTKVRVLTFLVNWRREMKTGGWRYSSPKERLSALRRVPRKSVCLGSYPLFTMYDSPRDFRIEQERMRACERGEELRDCGRLECGKALVYSAARTSVMLRRRICSQCNAQCYCSDECQRLDGPRHKNLCAAYRYLLEQRAYLEARRVRRRAKRRRRNSSADEELSIPVPSTLYVMSGLLPSESSFGGDSTRVMPRRSEFASESGEKTRAAEGCAQCGKFFDDHSGRKRCGRCRQVYYCSVACQKSHWPKHRKTCRQEGQEEAKTAQRQQ